VDEADVIELEKQYWSLKGTSKSGRFDIETFTAAVSPPMPEELCQGLYCNRYLTNSVCVSCFEKINLFVCVLQEHTPCPRKKEAIFFDFATCCLAGVKVGCIHLCRVAGSTL